MTRKRLPRLAAAVVFAAAVPLAAAASSADSPSPFSWIERIWDAMGSWIEGPAAGAGAGPAPVAGENGLPPGDAGGSAAPTPDQAGAGSGDEGPHIDPND